MKTVEEDTMKRKIIIVFIVLLIVILVYLFTFRKKITITDIESFHFSYTTGTAMFSTVSYDLKCESDKCTVKIKPNNAEDTKTKEIETDLKIKNEIKTILKKYQVADWNGFNKNDKHVLDGNSFYLNIIMEKEEITASGYMKYPKNFKEFSKDIDSIFLPIYNK